MAHVGSKQALFKKALERKSFFFPQGFFFSKEKGLKAWGSPTPSAFKTF